jgi:hypothetical protein
VIVPPYARAGKFLKRAAPLEHSRSLDTERMSSGSQIAGGWGEPVSAPARENGREAKGGRHRTRMVPPSRGRGKRLAARGDDRAVG